MTRVRVLSAHIAAFASLVWLIAAPAGAQQQPGTPLTIVVEDTSGGRIAAATVTLHRGDEQHTATAGPDGRAELRGVAPGTWTLIVSGAGFAPRTQTIVVAAAPATLSVRLDVPRREEAVVVRGDGRPPDSLQLDAPATGGSHLDISIRDLPASLTIVTREMMWERGAYSGVDAIEAAAGTEANIGSGSLMGFRTRGFSGASVSIMRDGIRQNTPSMSARPVDTFMLDRVEVLKGPASLLYGEGSVGAAVNYVSRAPAPNRELDALVSYGSFGTYRLGLGASLPITPELSSRVDISYSDTDGYVDPSGQRLRAVNASVLWQPSPRFSLKPSATYTDDYIVSYYSTPLVDGEVDPRMRFINYNMQDNFARAINNFGRLDAEAQLGRGWRLRNGFFAATQRLDWRNMEGYAYDAGLDMVRVSSYFLIWRNDLLVGNQTDLRNTFHVAGRPVNVITGVNVQRNDMERGVTPNPPGTGGVVFHVDPYTPEPIFDPGLPWQRQRDVLVNTRTVFAEAQTGLTDRLKLVSGLRWEQIRVDYWPDQTTPTADTRHYYPATGRVGAVHTIAPTVNLYASYSRATEPTTQLVSMSATEQVFNLTPSWQFEGGTKATLFQGRLDGTLAYYYIQKRDIPIRTEVDGEIFQDQIGRQRSQGVEANVAFGTRAGFALRGDVAVTLAEYLEFNQNVGSGFISRTGNTPPGVPVVIWNLTPSQRIGPATVAASVRRVGERWGDAANTVTRSPYTTMDAWTSFRVPGQQEMRMTVRVRNLMDRVYVRGGGSNTSARIDAPRSLEVSLGVGIR